MLQYYTYMQSHRKYIHTYTKMNLSTVKWAQWDKTQSRDLLGHFICVCIALCTIVAHNIAQSRADSFPSYPPDNHHCSDDVCLKEGGFSSYNIIVRFRFHRCLYSVNVLHGYSWDEQSDPDTVWLWSASQQHVDSWHCGHCTGHCTGFGNVPCKFDSLQLIF